MKSTMSTQADAGGPIRVAVIDNHETVRLGLASLLESDPRFTLVGSHAHVDDFWAVPGYGVDVVVLDLYLGRDDVLSTPAIGDIAERDATVLLHTSEERPVPLQHAIAAGASGLALKSDSSASLLDTIAECAAGEFSCTSTLAQALLRDDDLLAALTPREIDVLRGLDDGLTRAQVARRLEISEETVRSHLKSVRTKYLDVGRTVTNSTSLIRAAERDGWIDHRGSFAPRNTR